MPPINDADVKLMLAIIGSNEIKKDNDALAAIIGGGVTANAVRQRVSKVKNQAKLVLAGTDLDIKLVSNATPTSTPKRAAAPKTKKNTTKGANPDASDDNEASPSKKQKINGSTKGRKEPPKSKANVSASVEEEGQEQADMQLKIEQDLAAEISSNFQAGSSDEGEQGV